MDDEITVEQVLVNPDPKRTRTWESVRYALGEARRRRATRLFTELHADVDLTRAHREFRIEVLAPQPEEVLAAVGGTDPEGRTLSSNSLSAVVRIWRGDDPILLIAADVDEAGLETLLRDERDVRARMLLFPHHGGYPGPGRHGDAARAFAERLTAAVQPEIIAFSLGRGGPHRNPRPETVEGVRAVLAAA